MKAAALVMLAVAACTSASALRKPTLVPPESLDWNNATARNGIRRITLDGDRTGPGLFAERLVFPAGFSAPPHRHPIDLYVVVVRGASHLAFAPRLERAAATRIGSGGYFRIPAGAVHSEWFDEETEIHMLGTGAMATEHVPVAGGR